MFRLILMALSLFEAVGHGWDPNGSPVPQVGPGWDPNGSPQVGPGWDPDGLN